MVLCGWGWSLDRMSKQGFSLCESCPVVHICSLTTATWLCQLSQWLIKWKCSKSVSQSLESSQIHNQQLCLLHSNWDSRILLFFPLFTSFPSGSGVRCLFSLRQIPPVSSVLNLFAVFLSTRNFFRAYKLEKVFLKYVFFLRVKKKKACL